MNEAKPQRHYLDWAATAIPFSEDGSGSQAQAIDESLPSQGESFAFYGNPSAEHDEGRRARDALENARAHCAGVLQTEPEKLFFTSGGTESNTIVLQSFLLRKGKGRILFSGVEHPSIRENCRILEQLGIPIGVIGVEEDGRVTVASLQKALEKFPDTRLVAIMTVNNETGSINDIENLVAFLRQHQEKTGTPIHVHSDMVQALGKIPINLDSLDSASFSAHKLGGKSGIGILYLKNKIQSLYGSGSQEGGIRSGTENIDGAVSFSKLLETRALPETVREESEKARERFRYLIGELCKIPRCKLIPESRSSDDKRFSPWILQVRFCDIPGAVMVRALNSEGISVSTGSACSSKSQERPVLEAMGIEEEARLEGIRISQGWSTEISDLDAFLTSVKKVLSFL